MKDTVTADDEEREGEMHPLVSITKIDPDEIPEVCTRFVIQSTIRKIKKRKTKLNSIYVFVCFLGVK